jgi:nitrite reductase/ring-hydroxylating ferredoxin subunit
MVLAPPGDCFPAYPATWYLFCRSRALRGRPVSQDMLGRRLVGFRGVSGRVAVLEARCAHLGADLGRGRVAGDSIQCPFHHWEYGPDGRCTRIPTAAEIPEFARQMAYPVVERHGFVFFFNGWAPLFPLPFFFDCRPEEFVAGRPFRFTADCSWFMLAANGFDEEHFRAVHDRTLTGPAEVDCPGRFVRRMRYHARVTGNSIFDRLIRWFLGGEVDVSITSWGGPLILVTGYFRRARSYILIATRPLEDGQTFVEVVVFAPRSRRLLGWASQPVNLWARRLFTRGFMRDDIDRLGGVRYNPAGLIASDRLMIDFFQWAAALPRGPEGGGPRKSVAALARDHRVPSPLVKGETGTGGAGNEDHPSNGVPCEKTA